MNAKESPKTKHFHRTWYQSQKAAAMVLFFCIAGGLAVVVSIVLAKEGRSTFGQLTHQQRVDQGNLVIEAIGQEIKKIEEVTWSLKVLAENLDPEPQDFHDIIPEIMHNHDSTTLIAGGGVWPLPNKFKPNTERNSFFWGRSPQGDLEFFDGYNEMHTQSYTLKEWFVPATLLDSGSFYWSRSYTDPLTFETMTTCSAPYFRDGFLAGVVTVDVQLSSLNKYVSFQTAQTSAYIFCVDRNSRFLTYPNAGLAKNKTLDEAGKPVENFITTAELASIKPEFKAIADGLDQLNIQDMQRSQNLNPNRFKELDSFLSARCPDISSTEAQKIASDLICQAPCLNITPAAIDFDQDHIFHEGGQALVFHFPPTHWNIILANPQSAMDAPVSAITKQLISVIILPLIMAALLAFLVINSRFIQPLSKLTRQLQKQILDSDRGLLSLPENRRDELGELAFWFNNRTHDLIEAQTQAEKSARIKSTFLANMSHEIRTPMNGILGAANLLEPGNDPEEINKVEIIRNSAESLLTVLNDILDYSKMEAGEFTIQSDPFDLTQALEQCLHLASNLAQKKDLNLRLEIGSNEGVWILGDASRIRQIILNLLSNAIKFTPEGEVVISVMTDIQERLLRIEVRDTGVGISPSQQLNVFEVFQQADSSLVRQAGGTGLGLAISRQLCKLMGGDLTLVSKVGVGSCFNVALPLKLAQKNIEPLPAKKQKECPDFAMKILLAEDNPTNRLVAKMTLKKLGCQTITANDGIQALAMAESEEFDLIFMDMQMPNMDGLESCRKIRGLGGKLKTIPIVALTANAQEEDRKCCEEAGMNGFLTKPLRTEDLKNELMRWCPKNRSQVTVSSPPETKPREVPAH